MKIENRSKAIRRNVSAIVVVVYTGLLTACSQKVDGVYVGTTSVLLMPVTWQLKVSGEKAIMKPELDRPFALKVSYDDDRMVLTDGMGHQLAFHVRNHGATLECPACDAIHLPTVWERRS